MSEDTDSEDEENCSKNEECKNQEKPKKPEKDIIEEKDYNSEEDEQFNDANFMKSMKEGKYRDKHFQRFSKDNDGVEFTAFDLREENEEGHFDKNMNYIPNKEEYDPWYESVKDEVRQKELLKHKRKNDNNLEENNEKEDDKDEEYSKYGDEDLYYKEEKITKEEKEEIDKDIKINKSYFFNEDPNLLLLLCDNYNIYEFTIDREYISHVYYDILGDSYDFKMNCQKNSNNENNITQEPIITKEIINADSDNAKMISDYLTYIWMDNEIYKDNIPEFQYKIQIDSFFHSRCELTNFEEISSISQSFPDLIIVTLPTKSFTSTPPLTLSRV